MSREKQNPLQMLPQEMGKRMGQGDKETWNLLSVCLDCSDFVPLAYNLKRRGGDEGKKAQKKEG